MKVILIALAFLATVLAQPFEQKWMVPQADGSRVMMTESEYNQLASQERDDEIVENEDGIIYYLFTPNNPTRPDILRVNDIRSISQSHFNTNYNTRVLIHGWLGDTESVLNTLIEPYVNQKGVLNNVIFVDWSNTALTLNYAKARLRVRKVGNQIASFIDQLHAFGGMSYDKLTIIGHSLGTHVTGFVGKNVQLGRVNTIIGLDPAMVLFDFNKPNERLNSTDAEYVETVHTNGEWLGFLHPIGQAAFYPNWGKIQPGCEGDLSGYCSHARCVDFLIEAIELGDNNQFIPTECSDFEHVKSKDCSKKVEGIRMYDPNNYKKAEGLFYLPTTAEKPWGLGAF